METQKSTWDGQKMGAGNGKAAEEAAWVMNHACIPQGKRSHSREGMGAGGPAVSYLHAVQLDTGWLSLSRVVGTRQHQVAPSSKAQGCVLLWELEGDCWGRGGHRGPPCNDTKATVSHSH